MTQRPSIGLASVLARDDVTDPADPRVQEGIEDHEAWLARRERRRRAREEADDEQALLTSYTTASGDEDGEGQ